MRSRASFRRARRQTANDIKDFVHDAHNTESMLAIQDLVERAKHEPEEVQKGIIRAGLQCHLYPFEPRQKQIDAIWHLVFKKQDLLLTAKTSFGKSIIFQAAPLFCRGGIGLIIVPLDRIGQEQCIKIQRLPGARSVFINARTDKTDALVQEIETGLYTHLIMGPEIAAGWFRPIASNPSFKKRVSVVAVDELHLVALWGSGIRPQYAQLSLLRRRLGAHIPWFGCSATLDEATLDTARKMTGFQASCEFFRTSVDRPEIKLIVESIEPRTTKRFTTLFFVLQDAITNGSPTPEKIPKTVIFIDSRHDIQKCAECLRDWLHKLSAGVEGDIPDDESDVAADVIDYDAPEEQRRRKTNRERRTDLYRDSPALFNLVNRSACLRRILMDWLQESLSDPASKSPAPEPDECCNVCNPTLGRTIPFPWDIAPSLRRPQAGTASGAFYDRLIIWGDNVVNSAHQMVKPELSVRLFTQKGEWISMSTEYAYIRTAAELEEFVKSTWLKDHSDELFKEFNDIKSYVVRNWPGGSRLGTAAAAQVPIHRASLEGRSRLAPERQMSRKRRASVDVEAETQKSLDQDQRASFLRGREEYASSLERIIAKARETPVSFSPDPSTPTMIQAPANSPSTSIDRSIASTSKDSSSAIFTVFENELPGVIDGDQLSKRRASSRREGEMAKGVVLSVRDPNARRSPRREKGKNRRYDHREWIL